MNSIKQLLRGPIDLGKVVKILTELPYSEKTPYVVTIQPWQRNRSLAQRSLLHLWYSVIAKETGNSLLVVKEETKRMFLGYNTVQYTNHKTGEVKHLEVLKSTEELNMKEMSEFMTQVQTWAAVDLGITLPIPEDQAWAIKGK